MTRRPIDICFRTKGSHSQGVGDVTGSLSIAGELVGRGHRVKFIVDDHIGTKRMVRARGYGVTAVHDGGESAAWQGKRFDIVVVNRMTSPARLLRCARKRCKMLVTIDDTGKPSEKIADIRINPLYYAKGALCDPGYIPLEKIFYARNRKKKTVAREVAKMIVTMGGADTYGYTPQIIPVLDRLAGANEIVLVVGPAFKHHRELSKALSCSRRSFKVCRAVTHERMRELMLWADLAICAAGNTLFEMACCGTPAVVVASEPFEEETAYRLGNMGFGKVIGFNKKLDGKKLRRYLDEFGPQKERRRHSEAGMRLVSGRGVELIADEIIDRYKRIPDVKY